MTGRSLFLVAPESPSSLPPESVLLGLPMIRRTVLAAERAGFDSIAVAADDPADSLTRALAGTSARLVPSGAPIPSGAAVLRWNRVLRTGEIKQLATGASPAPAGVAVSSAADRRPAERWLLDGLVKDTEGFMSRHFERRVSLEISRRLSATSITPNQMTVFSTAVGLVGALFFLSPRASMQTAGALLFLLHSILDGCDGEIARLKFQESRWGGLLDFWGDNAVHAAIFACIAIGWSQSIGQAWPLWVGLAAVAGTLASAGVVHQSTMQRSKEGPLFTSVTPVADSPLSRVVDLLGRRDFIYLVLALSLFGRAQWFLLASAVGAPIFSVVLAALARRHAQSPNR